MMEETRSKYRPRHCPSVHLYRLKLTSFLTLYPFHGRFYSKTQALENPSNQDTLNVQIEGICEKCILYVCVVLIILYFDWSMNLKAKI